MKIIPTILPIKQSSCNQNQTNFKGTVQVLVKRGQDNSIEVRDIFQKMLESHGPTAIQNTSNKRSFYRIKASFFHGKDGSVYDSLIALVEKYKGSCRVDFNYTPHIHALTPKKLKRFNPPIYIFDDKFATKVSPSYEKGSGMIGTLVETVGSFAESCSVVLHRMVG